MAGEAGYTIIRRITKHEVRHHPVRHGMLGHGKYVVCFPRMSDAYMVLDLARRGVRTTVSSSHDKTRVLLNRADDEIGEAFIVRFDEVRSHVLGLNDVSIAVAHKLLYFEQDRMMFDASLVEPWDTV